MPNPPRISANDLALYMVSSTTAQIGIVKRAKAPITPPIIRYKDARPAVKGIGGFVRAKFAGGFLEAI